MALSRPDWFDDLDAWWRTALGVEASSHLEPLGVDTEGRLHLRGITVAWAAQATVLSAALTARLNAALPPPAQITGIVVRPAPE
ncbi:hypothetical protein GCM10010289_74450 [Streptomyces violascens]|nr:hypothetical protein GCM10010289_74450 [Streptomyces violascens]